MLEKPQISQSPLKKKKTLVTEQKEPLTQLNKKSDVSRGFERQSTIETLRTEEDLHMVSQDGGRANTYRYEDLPKTPKKNPQDEDTIGLERQGTQFVGKLDSVIEEEQGTRRSR